MLHKLIFDTTDATTRAASAQVGAILYDGVNDRLGVINASQELQVRDDDANTTLASILADTTSIDGTLTALSKSEDAAHSSGDQGIQFLAVRNDTEGTLVDTDGDYAPLQVDADGRLRVVADLEITNSAEKAEDSAHVSGDIGNFVLAVRNDTLGSLVDTDGDYSAFQVNASGELYVTDESAIALLTTIDADTSNISTNSDTLAGAVQVEDAAHSSGDTGYMNLAVRKDAVGSLVDTDGDYAPNQVNAVGELRVLDIANTAIATAANTLAVANTAEDLVASPLANRKFLFVYNNDNQTAYIGASGVTSANGFPIFPGSIMELRAGAAIDIEFVSAKVGLEMRTMELS